MLRPMCSCTWKWNNIIGAKEKRVNSRTVCEGIIVVWLLPRSWKHGLDNCKNLNCVNNSLLSKLTHPSLCALYAALKTHFSGLASSLSPLQQFDWISILLLQSTLRAVFVREKCTTNGIYYWYGLILRPAVLWGVCFSPTCVLLCSTWSW